MRAIFSALAVILLAVTPVRPATPAVDPEYQVKAAFLFNFLKFVEWPDHTGTSPWVIGVLGQNPFGDVLGNSVRGKTVNGRSVEVRHYARLADVKDCHILFVGRADFQRLGVASQPGLLTVGEAPGFLKAGGIVNFYLEENRVRFEIQHVSARSAGLEVSSQLLKLAKAF